MMIWLSAIRIYNENRDKVRALYEFRKADPPLISGTELTMVLTVGSSLPIGEANTLFDQVLAEIRQRGEISTQERSSNIY